jgi:hypothetical protein
MVEGQQHNGYKKECNKYGGVSFSVNSHLFRLKNVQEDEIQKYKRCGNKDRIKPVKNSAMTGKDFPRIFKVQASFQ